MTARGSLTVRFDPPFWVGLCERSEQGRYEVCKVVFGAQPQEAEVYAFVLHCWDKLRFSPALPEEEREAKCASPKRIQRQISASLHRRGMSTKAQQALANQRETMKRESAQARSQRRADEAEARFEQRKLKHKQQHRGH